MELCLTRQPIFDRNHMAIGYELIYSPRKPEHESYNPERIARITVDGFLNMNLERFLGGHIVFLPFTREMLLLETTLLLDKSTTIIEIPRSMQPDDFIIDTLEHLKAEGFLIALSDYTWDYPHESIRSLCDIIKVSLNMNTAIDLRRILMQFQMTTHVLLATEVDTHSDYSIAKELGFELFHGNYFAVPSVSTAKVLKQSQKNSLDIIKMMEKHEPNIPQIAKHIESDVNLTIKLLKLVNSTHYFSEKIHSVQHALAILGLKALRAWINLAILDDLVEQPEKEAIKLSILRMRFLEVIAERSELKYAIQELKLLGILSVLDVLYHQPLAKALRDLPVDKQIKNTLLGEHTDYSNIYLLIRSYESAKFDRLAIHCHAIGIDMSIVPDIYTEAVVWTDALYLQLYPEDKNIETFSI